MSSDADHDVFGGVGWLAKLTRLFSRAKPDGPEHLRRGRLGEDAARRELERAGLRFLTANFRSDHGELDLVFRDGDCLQYVSFAINIWSELE